MARTNQRIEWLNDLVRLEITLWNRVNAELLAKQGLTLAFFEVLYAIGQTDAQGLRVGDVAQALKITGGAASKLADRVVAAGLVRRELDADDRRVSRLVLTEAGQRQLAASGATYAAALAAILDTALSREDQRHMHELVGRLLAVAADPTSA